MNYDAYGRELRGVKESPPFWRLRTMVFGVVMGTIGGPLVILTNQNYAFTEAMAPFIVGALAFMAVYVASAVFGLIFALVGRGWFASLWAGQSIGLGIGGIALQLAERSV